MINKIFGRLLVKSEEERILFKCGKYHRSFLCKCECGNKKIIDLGHLKSGHTTSCGCYRKEEMTTHGMNKTLEHVSWDNMKSRCFNSKSINFKYYGGRGITICREWLKFENFFADMGTKPSKEHSIDRIDNNNGYYKENCRWATKKEQARNKRNNINIEHQGRIQCLTDWAKELGISHVKLWYRLYKLKWSIERSLTT